MEEKNDGTNPEEKTSATLEAVPSEDRNSAINKSSGSPAPHEEQRRYWQRDLFYKLMSLLISGLGFVLIIIGLFANYRQVSINTEQLEINTAQAKRLEKSVRANVQNAVLANVVKLDQVFIEKTYLIPYFHGNRPIDEKDEKYLEVDATAEMVLDIFDLIAVQNKTYPEFWDSPQAWDEWIIDVFSTSPILREKLDKHPTWYDDDLMNLRNISRNRIEEKAKEKAATQVN